MPLEKGMVQIYTGNGKGKTTAALGLGLRSAGSGLKVYMIQFMKGNPYGELDAVKEIPNFDIVQYGRTEFVNKKNPAKIDIKYARDALEHAKEIIKSKKYDVVILDEINVALDYELIEIEDVLKIIKEKPDTMELILTGRYAPSKIVKKADLVTEMLEIKHPFQKGMPGRKGIEW